MSTQLLGIVGGTDPVGYDAFGGSYVYDSERDELYLLEVSVIGAGANGIKRFSVGTTGTEDAQVLEATLYPMASHVFNGIAIVNPVTRELFGSLDGSNSRPISRINGGTLALIETYGVDSSDTTMSVPGRILASRRFVAAWTANSQYLVSAAVLHPEVAILTATAGASMGFVSAQWVTDDNVNIGPGPNGGPTATVYAIGYGAFPSATTLRLWKFVVPSGGGTLIRTIDPGQIDPSWTNFGDFSGPGYDPADGGVLCFFLTTTVGVGNSQYLVKFSPMGEILWKMPVAAYAAVDLAQTAISNSQLLGHNLVTPNFISVVDLTNGTSSEIEFNHGMGTLQGQIGAKRAVIGVLDSGGYMQASGPIPVYLGAWLADNADTVPVHRHVRAWPGGGAPKSYVEVI